MDGVSGRFFIDTASNGEDFTVLQNGNVGIGTTSPSSKLFVNGTIRNSDNVNTTGDPGIMVTSGDRLGFDQSGVRSWTTKATDGNLDFNSGDGLGYSKFNMGLLVSGNVGIGTTSPGANLHIGKQEATPAGTAGSVDRLYIQPYSNTGGPYKFIARTVSGASDYLDMYYGTTQIMSWGIGGNVGIGTTSPGSKLHIISASP